MPSVNIMKITFFLVVSLLAVTEYENLLKQYTDQEKLKGAIESKLKEVEEENKELRKANRISPNISIIPVNSNQVNFLCKH